MTAEPLVRSVARGAAFPRLEERCRVTTGEVMPRAGTVALPEVMRPAAAPARTPSRDCPGCGEPTALARCLRCQAASMVDVRRVNEAWAELARESTGSPPGSASALAAAGEGSRVGSAHASEPPDLVNAWGSEPRGCGR